MDQNKYQDNAWIVNYVASCLVGDALRWHIALPHEIQDDWRRLQTVLLTRWSASGEPPRYCDPGSPVAPTARIARIRVARGQGSPAAYVSHKTSTWGSYVTTSTPREALLIKYTPSSGLQRIEVLNGEYPLLCASWEHANAPILGPGSFHHAYLSSMDETTVKDSRHRSGPERACVWKVGEDDQLQASWKDDRGVDHQLSFVVGSHSAGELVDLVIDYAAFAAVWGEAWKQARLHMELV